MSENIIEVKDISKRYPGVMALKGVSFNIKKNTVHCIVGENGAGKSTFIKIMTGAIQRSGGKILYNGKDYQPKNIKDAMKAGMSVLYQELNVVDDLTVKENLTLGIEESKRMHIATPGENQNVANLSGGNQQKVVLAKCIASDCSVLILDEPTRGVDVGAKEEIYSLIRQIIKEGNVSVIVMSSELPEILGICDRIILLYERLSGNFDR